MEPLGDRVVLEPNILYEIVATDALSEIVLSSDGFTVYGWVTQVAIIDEDGTSRTVWKVPD